MQISLVELERSILASERAVHDLTPGTEKQIVWARGQRHMQTEFSIVYIHGFSASRQEIAPICDRLAHHLAANLFYTRLPGHGRQAQPMAGLSVESMLQATREALDIGRALGRRVIIIANSTGASLANIVLAEEPCSEYHAFVALSPNFRLQGLRARLLDLPGRRRWLHLAQGQQYCFAPQNAAQSRYWTCCYPSEALLVMHEIMRRARAVATGEIQLPTMMIYCARDRLLNTRLMRRWYQRLPHPDNHVLVLDSVGSTQQHVTCGDILSPQTNDQVIGDIENFLNRLI